MRLISRFVQTASLVLALASPLAPATVRAQAAHAATAVLPSAGKPLVHLKSPQTVEIRYTGSAAAVAALKSGAAEPTALAAADFNADGAMDVVAGYATAKGGVVTLLLANPDAFAPKDTSLYAKAMRGDVPATFLSTATAYAVPESAELIVTGDFNRDGRQDVLVAARGGNLYMLAGDGHGKLGTPQLVPLDGAVRAMSATPDGHVAVSIAGEHSPEVQILAPGKAGLTASRTYPLPVAGDSVAWGTLGGGAGDLAIGAGSNIVIIYGALGEDAQFETVTYTDNGGNILGKVDKATKFIPTWVKVAVALALGMGTMVGWKRIVVTIGEKIGKEHLTYAQGATAELVAMATIFAADNFGLPVSTTHVLSSGIAGTMAANRSGLQMSTIRNIAAAWVFTLPAAALLSGTLFWLFRQFSH